MHISIPRGIFPPGRPVTFVLGAWLLLVLCANGQAAAEQTGFVDKVFRDSAGEHKYVVFVPAGYSPGKKWPVLLNLHGAGERGTDGKLQTMVGLGPLVRARAATFPFIVVFPQASTRHHGQILTTWYPGAENGRRALAILDEVEKNYSVNSARRYLTGWSMGGYGAWAMAAADPDKFAAVVPLSGGGEVALGAKLGKVRLWAFHGTKDEIVHASESQKLIDAVRQGGGHPRYTEYSNTGHDVWKYVYDNETLYRWLLDPQTPVPADGVAVATPGPTPIQQYVEPFHPAVDIPRAVYVRLGNEMLTSLARSVPFAVPADMLVGRVNDIHDSTEAMGRTFQVALTGISYSGQIVRAQVKAYKKDRVNIQLGLQNVVLQIAASEVEGRWRTVTTGTMYVVIGCRAPVWLSIDVTPYVENRELKLRLAAVGFSIPDDNWYVTRPVNVENAGLIMSAERVSDGLVTGVYSKKQTIEQQVVSVIPALLPELQKRLKVTEINDVVSGFWPLPVYKPRVQAWPEAVSTDEHGISLLMGVTAASVDPNHVPKRASVVTPLGPELSALPHHEELQLGVAPNLLNPLTDLMVKANVARVHVLDIPERTFAPFVSRDALAAAIPDLKQLGDSVEISSEMVLLAPLSVVDGAHPNVPATKPAGDAKPSGTGSETRTGEILFRAPRVGIEVAIRTQADAEWKPYAELEFNIEQPAAVRLTRPTFDERAVGIEWSGSPQISAIAKFSKDYQPKEVKIDVEKLREMFTQSWNGWTSTTRASHTSVPDVDFGYSKLRLDHADWNAPYLFATFDKPGVKLSNLSEVPLQYELKGAYSGWGGPYTLKPGSSAEFDVDSPILFRRENAGALEMFTLPVGSESEFRLPSVGKEPRLLKARRPAAIAKEGA